MPPSETARDIDTTSPELLARVDGAIAVVTLNRPDRANALSPSLVAGLVVALSELARPGNIGCLVLTGAGNHFSAGGDMRAVRAGNDGVNGAVAVADLRRRHTEVVMALRDFPALTIAAIRGAAVGAGMALGLACDFRVGDPTAAFTTGFISAGSAGDFGGSYLLTQLIGPARAKEALVFNETFDATTAHGLGLLNRLVEAEEWEPTWRDMAGRIAAGPRLAQRVVKENVNRAVESDLRTCLDYEAFATIALMQSEDHAEARRAFADRRPPRFGGE